MKKIVASVGLVALGASSLQAASLLSIEGGKPWTVSATLRGFFDDNINAAPDAADLTPYHRGSWGFEVSPTIALNFPMDATTLSLGYTYSYKYYEHQLAGSTGNDISSHTFNMALDHAFNERYSIDVKDSFVIGQEPDLLRTGNAMTTFQVVPGNNIRNFGQINFKGQATRLFGYELGYANSFYDYRDEGMREDFFGNGIASLSGLLDRLEHVGHFDTRWVLAPTTTGILGYQYREVDYTGDEIIALPDVKSDMRNSRSHYVYAGIDHAFNAALTGSVRGGAQFTDYYNDPNTDSSVSPYVLLNLRYTYMPESFVEVGATHDRNATDVLGINADQITMDQESTVAYISLTHRITPKLFGSIIGQYQYSEFNGGEFDSESENYWAAGINLEYRFNPHFSAHAGYNYDMLDSNLGAVRNLDRNRVYFGITASY